jgi:predicted ribosomally synthesized peptide with nif11-like leader
MSKQTALEFIHRVNDDAGLRTKIKGVDGNLDGLMHIAADAGFAFNEADWNAAVAEMASDTSRALSNAELANVAGGLSTQTSGGAFDWGDSFLSRRMGKFLGD